MQYSVSGYTLGIIFKLTTAVGNSFVLAASSAGVTVSGPTLWGAGGMVTFTCPTIDLVNFSGDYVYDCRLELGGINVAMFGGTITFLQGSYPLMTDTTYVISGVPDANDANPLAPTLADAITSAQTQAVISAAAAATATNQAIAATAQAVAAANSAVDASGYAINAASSAGASAASAVSANGAVYNAASLLDAASISAAAANGSALAAATEAGNSLASAINSANAAVAAGASQTSAAGSAISASASQESASISETNAGLSASAASASEIAAANNVIFLKSNYQGSLAADPLLDLAGNALTTAAWYYNSTINRIKIYSGSVWAVALNTILTTVGAPASGVGQADDFAIDSANWIIYGPKVPGSWPSGVSMLGPASVVGPSSSTAGHFATFLTLSGQVRSKTEANRSRARPHLRSM